MAQPASERVDWRDLWTNGDLARFCFISLGVLLHATNETMVATVMPAMVEDLSGVELIGWSLAIYELGAIVSGAAAGRLVSYVALRTNMVVAAVIFAVGALICATAISMPMFLVGRLVEGFGGGALVSLAFVTVERLFPPRIWPQLFGIISAIWGVAAFSGPLIGAAIVEILSWRWAFGVFTIAALGMAVTCNMVLNSPEARRRAPTLEVLPPFPYAALAVLGIAVLFIASAGVNIELLRSTVLLGLGLLGLVAFFQLDRRNARTHLFPSRMFDARTTLGRGMIMVGVFSISTCSLAIYGPLLLTTLHDISLLTTGFIIASEAIAWSVMSMLVANAAPRREPFLILTGALMITSGIAGFAFAIPSGSIALVLACAVLQGGGFGIAWPFFTRIIVSSAAPEERTIAASAVPTLQRIGYATGSALAGIVANVAGFSVGLDRETAAAVAPVVFLAFLPLALVGVSMAVALVSSLPKIKAA